MNETLQDIANYLRGHKIAARSDDPRQWATFLDQVIQPQLEELAKLKGEGKKGKA